MADERKRFGDEGYIYSMSLQQEMPTHENNVLDGYIMIGGEKIPFKKNGILDGDVSMIMPEDVQTMPQGQVDARYGTEDCPDIIYTFFKSDINLALSYKEDLPSEDEDIPDVKDLIERMMMRGFPGSKVIESATMEVNGKNVAYFDFTSEVYNMLFFFSIGGCLILGSFECYITDMDNWKPVFLQMLESIDEVG